MSNLKEYVYQLVDKNIALLDLTSLVDHPIKLNVIDDFIKDVPCAKKYYNLLKKIYSNVIYVSKSDAEKIYNQNADEIIEFLRKNKDYVPILNFYRSKRKEK